MLVARLPWLDCVIKNSKLPGNDEAERRKKEYFISISSSTRQFMMHGLMGSGRNVEDY